jgi:hypothetical protein
MLDTAKANARRGELRLSVPFGFIWHREPGLDLDPNRRSQEVLRLIFIHFRELGSAGQVLLSKTAGLPGRQALAGSHAAISIPATKAAV